MAYQTMVLEDDYVTAEAPSYYFPLYTSLKGFGTAGVRDPTGHVGEAAGSTGVAFPTISLTYPEAEVLPGRLLLNGSPFLAVAEGRLVIQPLQADTQISLPALAGNLQLDFGPSIRVGYHVELYEDTACSALVRNWDVVSAQGVAIQELLHEDATTAIVTPIYDDGAIQTYIRAIRLDSGNLSQIRDFMVAGGNRSLSPYEPVLTVLLADYSDGIDRTAFVTTRSLVQVNSMPSSTGHVIRVPVSSDVQSMAVLGHAIDRLSLERYRKKGPEALQALSQRPVLPDLDAPLIEVLTPMEGSTVRPLMELQLVLEDSDNSKGLRSLQLFQNGSELVSLSFTVSAPHGTPISIFTSVSSMACLHPMSNSTKPPTSARRM